MKDYYAVLGVSESASHDEVKKAFRALAQKYHPDKQGGDEKKFKEISEAYAVVGDEGKRKQYDTQRKYGAGFGGQGQGAGGFGGFDFSGFANGQGMEFDLGDIFGDIFGGGGGGRRREVRGSDLSVTLEATFEEAVFGFKRTITLSRKGTCDSCHGNGAEKGSELHTCSTCSGSGSIREVKRSFMGSFETSRVCSACHGTGKIPKNKCKACAGVGIKQIREEVVISIPAGIEDGEMLRMTGKGEAVVGGATGDLYVKVRVKNHSVFERQGSNLLCGIEIKLSDALLGSEYPLKTLDGEISVTIPEGIRHGEMLRVKGKGVPMGSGKRGDIIITVSIMMPKKISKAARKTIEELRKEGL